MQDSSIYSPRLYQPTYDAQQYPAVELQEPQLAAVQVAIYRASYIVYNIHI